MNLSGCWKPISCILFGVFIVGCQTDDQKDPAKAIEKKQTPLPPNKDSQPEKFTIANGFLSFEIPTGWNRVEPRFRMIDVEFSIPTEIDGQPEGRVTVMGAGGSVEENIDRWVGQFRQPDGSETKPQVDKQVVLEQDVTWVELSGTYLDRPVPIRPESTERENYRMLAAIIQSKGHGNYFVKFYGNSTTVAKHQARFKKMIENLEVSK